MADRSAALRDEERVTPLELFFDLVFVFAFTQVTGSIAADPTWAGMGEGLLMLGAVWFAWTSYSWLTDSLDPERGITRVIVLVVMAAMFVVALALPDAFGREALLFALAYFFVRAMHLVLYAVASRHTGDAGLMDVVRGLAPSMLGAASLLIVASAFDGTAQAAIWILALTVEIVGPFLGRMEGWRVSASHFAERYGLVVIIALGESVVAIGLSAEAISLSTEVVIAAILGVAIAGALWWAYFDVVAIVAEGKLVGLRGTGQTAMARDSYTFIHYFLVAGIILFALGAKKALAQVDQPLDDVPAVALCGGVALYFLGHVAFRLRNLGTLNPRRLAAAVVALALIPLAMRCDAILAMAAVTVVCIAVTAYEATRFSEMRARIRHGD
jgi:low temperature requirement protein LtrA